MRFEDFTTDNGPDLNVYLVNSSTGDVSDFVDLGDIPKGTKISITGVEKNKRAQIIWKGAVRWVTAEYLSQQLGVLSQEYEAVAEVLNLPGSSELEPVSRC